MNPESASQQLENLAFLITYDHSAGADQHLFETWSAKWDSDEKMADIAMQRNLNLLQKIYGHLNKTTDEKKSMYLLSSVQENAMRRQLFCIF